MPYNIIKNGNKYELRLVKNNQLLGTHKTKKEAQKQIQAIEINKKPKSKIIDGYEYFKSDKPNKKLMVNVNNKWVHFGAYPYQHFYDETELLDDKYNHYDIDRKYRYLKRSANIKNKEGQLTAYDPESPNYHAMRILWEF